MTNIKYVLYFRVSTKGQGESGLGLEAQKAYLSHYIPEEDVAATFTEVRSGKSMDDREELQKALALCEEQGYGLAVAKVDRLSRKTEEALMLLPRINDLLFCADLPMRPGDRIDKFMLTLFLAIADRERELIGLRTKAGLDRLKERHGMIHHRKGHVSNWNEGGRQRSLETRQRASQKAYRPITNYIVTLRERGDSLAKIADQLSEDGYKTVRGAKFTPTAVKRIIDNQAA